MDKFMAKEIKRMATRIAEFQRYLDDKTLDWAGKPAAPNNIYIKLLNLRSDMHDLSAALDSAVPRPKGQPLVERVRAAAKAAALHTTGRL